MKRITLQLTFDESTVAWLDQEQGRRAKRGTPASHAEIVEPLIVKEAGRIARIERVRKSHEERQQSQRHNAQKQWRRVAPRVRSQAMQQLGQQSWAKFPTAEERSQEMRRRLPPRPPRSPKPPKVKLIGKREHVCPEHDRDYTKGKGLFGKWRGIFPQAEHVRGKRRDQ